MARKKFTIEKKFSDGFAATEREQDRFVNPFENLTLSVSKITPDPTNPRQINLSADELAAIALTLKEEDFEAGVELVDKVLSVYKSKFNPTKETLTQIDHLRELAVSIHNSGLLHPIVTYKNQDEYQIVSGESRFLAHILLGKIYIDSRVFSKKPSNLNIKVAQYIENVKRTDLTPYGKVLNVVQIKDEFDAGNASEISSAKLAQLLGCGKTMASYYLLLTTAPADVLQALKDNLITNIKKAAELSKETNKDKRAALIQAESVEFPAVKVKTEKKKAKSGVGRKISKISLGSTKKPSVAKIIIESIVSANKLSQYDDVIKGADWSDLSAINQIFSEILKDLEKRTK